MASKITSYDGVKLQKGAVFQGIIISRTSKSNRILTGVKVDGSGIRTIKYTSKGWMNTNKHLKRVGEQ